MYSASSLVEFGSRLLDAAGMDPHKSPVISEVLVEADLMGHDTHGLNLLAPYLVDIRKGALRTHGEPKVVADFPAAVTWDGDRLPGTWLVSKAIELAIPRAKEVGTCSVAIRRGHHIACLAAYLKRVTDQGMVILLMSSAPENQSVAPHGGRTGAITPNPIAAGWPTQEGPVLIDVSMSITTNGMVGRLAKEGGRLPGPWLVDAQGNPTDDPTVMSAEPKGALLPMGGVEYGHKGYALGLLVEAMTQGFPGHGRADPIEGWTGEVFLQILDPALFSGVEAFTRQTQWVADACHRSVPRPGVARVRLPGEAGLARRERALAEGVNLHPGILPQLEPWARELGVPLPQGEP
ncbi:MAG: Ldh family oxidoreductase [Betaproteobacteria bacterium]|nr:Ldh family oxidoreductase [Betaproteobacteria bacterium]